MFCFIISSDRSTHSSAKLFNINTDVREAVVRTYSIQLANGSSAIHTQVKTNRSIVLSICKAFVLVQVFTSKLPASFSADIRRDILRRNFKERCCVCIKPTNILIPYITSWSLLSIQNSTPIPITLYNFRESNAAANIRQSQHQCQSRLPASILNVQFYFLYAM